MKHLLRNIKASNYTVLAQFKVGSICYGLNTKDKLSNISINGYDIIDCKDTGIDYNKIAHLIKDLVINGLDASKTDSIQAYILNEAKLSDSILSGIKKDLGSSIKVINQSMEIPHNFPVKIDFEEAFAPERFLKKIRDFAQTVHDINETLKVCREDIISITCNKLVDSMWGAKPTQQILEEMKESAEGNEDWEKVEFYTNIILKSIDRLVHKLEGSLINICNEEKKVVNTVLIPNIIHSFEKIKSIVSDVLLMLSNFVYIDEVFKKNTSYPANWFINADMFKDLKLDYKNLILFALKIPRFEQEIIYPLDMMRHNFINKN